MKKEETRLDSIDKRIEEFFEGLKELKEAQKRTDEQLNRTDKQLNRTDEQLNRTDEQLRQTDREIRELREAQKKTDEQIRLTDEQLRKTIKKLDRIGQQLADLGLVQGEVAEDLFYRNLTSLFRKQQNLHFSKVKRNLRRKGVGEYDLVAVDGGRVLVFEVKNKLSKRMVDEFVGKLPSFTEVFSEYRGYRIIGGMGALVVKDDVGRYAEHAGLYVMTQTDEGGAALLNREGFKAKEFN